MKGPTYSVVGGVVVILGLFGIVSRALQPLVPPPAENALSKESSDYLRAARHQAIPWQRPTVTAFAEARRTQKNILVVIGASWSKDAREFDRTALAEPEVQEHLRRTYVCLRVDASEEPWWMQAYLPLSRVALSSFDPGFQMWVLDPEAQLIGYVEVPAGPGALDAVEFLRLLRQVREQEEDMLAGRTSQPAPGTTQRLEHLRVDKAPPTEPPSLNEYSAALIREADFDTGGFIAGGRLFLRPQTYINLFLGGKTQEGKAYLDRVLSSNVVDWLDGGFFRGSSGQDWRDVEYDKVAVLNAEMLKALALASATTGDSFYADVSLQFADWLLESLPVGPFVPTARIGDENAVGRSSRASFAASEVRTLFGTGPLDRAQRSFARDGLSLDVANNKRMTLWLQTPRDILAGRRAQFLAVRTKLRAEDRRVRKATDPANLEVGGMFAARLLEVARLLGSEELGKGGLALADTLSSFRNGAPHHTLKGGEHYLGAYLALADSCLADYLLSGRYPSFLLGLDTLKRAQAIFASKNPGVWSTISVDGKASMPPDTVAPEVLDNVGSSCEARGLRLLYAYGVIRGGADGKSLVRESVRKRQAYGSLIASFGVLGAGFMNAVASVRGSHALVTGVNAVEEASELARLAPLSLVAPVAGFDHPELAGRGPGIYVGRDGVYTGPFNKDAAVAQLRRTPGS